jgi:hypothetical protein
MLMTTKKTTKNNEHPQPETEHPKWIAPNYELGQHYNFNAFRFEGLSHKMQGLIVGGTDHLGKEEWTFMVLIDNYVQAQCPCSSLEEARRTSEGFQRGHLVNSVLEWAGRLR